MTNGEALWQSACQILQQKMVSVSYNTWIKDNLTPLAETDHVLLLKCRGEVFRDAILKSHIDKVREAVCTAAAREMSVEILCGEQADERARALSDGEHAGGAPALNPKYTFETFVVGSGNRFAHAVSLAVAEMPAKAYNPLFIYGGVGLGKTHLMHAIGHYAHELYPELNIVYITSEAFTNQLVAAMQNNTNEQFRERFRSVDILLVDDIQFIAGKHGTEEEFFHTFNALKEAGKQIVMTSDKPPKEIQKLEERLCSRFEGGLVADIQRPEFETRYAILRKKAEYDHLTISDDILKLIAQNIESNVRELEGSLTRLTAYSSLTNRPIDMQLASEALREMFRHQEARQITAEGIQEAVANYYNIQTEDIQGPSRVHEFMVPRQLAMYLCREMLNMSLTSIGDAFGGRHYTTVMSSINKVEESMKKSPEVATVLDQIRGKIKEI